MARFNGNALRLFGINGNGIGCFGLQGNCAINADVMQTPTSNLSHSQHLSWYPDTDTDREVRYEPKRGVMVAARAGRLGCFAGVLRCRGFARFANPAIQSRWPLANRAFLASTCTRTLSTSSQASTEWLEGHTRIPPTTLPHVDLQGRKCKAIGKQEKLVLKPVSGWTTKSTAGGK